MSRGHPTGHTTVTVHQPLYFPWLGFIHKLGLADVYIVLDDCKAIKRSWMNRVKIRTNVGVSWLSVPIFFRHRSKQLVKDIQICYEQNWPRTHLRTIEQHYIRAPHVELVVEIMAAVVRRRWSYLIDLNQDCLQRLLSHFGVAPRVVSSSTLGIGDVTGTQRLADLVSAVGGDTYLAGLGSDGYLEPRCFEEQGIGLRRQQYRCDPYPQIGNGEFLPGLSVIDTLANIGVAGAQHLIERNNHLTSAGSACSSLRRR